jgi:serine/threonine protein phosphatase PrpC
MRFQSWCVTDKGRKRESNQDSYLIDERLGVFIVADGVGGHTGGEDAAAFYRKMTDKFEDKGIQVLFGQLANFQDECRLLLESYGAYLTQGTPASQPSAYWDET